MIISRFFLATAASVLLLAVSASHAATLKIATLSPEGSAWGLCVFFRPFIALILSMVSTMRLATESFIEPFAVICWLTAW